LEARKKYAEVQTKLARGPESPNASSELEKTSLKLAEAEVAVKRAENGPIEQVKLAAEPAGPSIGPSEARRKDAEGQTKLAWSPKSPHASPDLEEMPLKLSHPPQRAPHAVGLESVLWGSQPPQGALHEGKWTHLACLEALPARATHSLA